MVWIFVSWTIKYICKMNYLDIIKMQLIVYIVTSIWNLNEGYIMTQYNLRINIVICITQHLLTGAIIGSSCSFSSPSSTLLSGVTKVIVVLDSSEVCLLRQIVPHSAKTTKVRDKTSRAVARIVVVKRPSPDLGCYNIIISFNLDITLCIKYRLRKGF